MPPDAPERFRDGHWVSTSRPFPGAHTTPDGRAVGVYVAGHHALEPASDGQGDVTLRRVWREPHVAIRSPDGFDLFRLVGQRSEKVAVHPDELPDLEYVVLADHLPEFDRAHLPPGTRLVPAE